MLLKRVSRADLEREILSRRLPGRFYRFVRSAWPHVESTPFVDGKVIEVVCQTLEEVADGTVKQQIINIPPGHSKSLLTSVFWPAWAWTEHPDWRWLHTSYSDRLSKRDAAKCLKLIQSPWYQARWGHKVRPIGAKPQIGNFSLTGGGWRISTTMHGQITGEHPHVHVCDDPIKPVDANGGSTHSRVELDNVYDIWTGTMATRAIDPAQLRRVVIMQRLHEADLAGRMIDEGGYRLLRLPARYERDQHSEGDWRTEEGELLWPERFPEEAVALTEGRLATPEAIASQMQQRPVPKGGMIFQRDWIQHWHYKPGIRDPLGRVCAILPEIGGKIQSWDMAFKKSEGSDRVAGGVLLHSGPRIYLIDADVEIGSFVQTLDRFVSMTARHPDAYEKLIEDKANGTGIEDMLKSRIAGITLVEPKGSKESRASAAAPIMRSGHFYVPHPDLFPWVNEVVKELVGFPRSRYDDIVDMISQAILHLQSHWQQYQKAVSA